MFESIAKQFATTAIALGSMLFGTVAGTDATFTPAELSSNGNEIVITTRLDDCFTEEMDKLFQSGKSITINFRMTVHNSNNDVILFNDFYHQVKYSLVDDYFQVHLSEHERTLSVMTIEEVHDLLASVSNYEVMELSRLEPEEQYQIQLISYMEEISLPGREEQIHLMNYWNNTEPTLRTPAFDRTQFAL